MPSTDNPSIIDHDLPKKRRMPRAEINDAGSSTIHERWLEEQLRLRSAPRKKVLWIEDDVDLAGLVGGELKKTYPCRIDMATNTQQAISRATQECYDLIILDWHLPELNGGQTLMSMETAMFAEPDLPKKWENKSVPVVIFSSASMLECLFKSTIHFNYAGFISKSQPLEHIFDMFARWIDPREIN
jgi:CheY-like chemotaxis protein